MKTLENTTSIELIISVIIGLMTVYLTKILVMKFYLKKTHEANPYKNLSFMIFLSGTIFSVSYIYSIMLFYSSDRSSPYLLSKFLSLLSF